MPQNKGRFNNPLEQAMETGIIGAIPDTSEGKNATIPTNQPAIMPEFQNSSTPINAYQTAPQARIPEFQQTGTQESRASGSQASPRAKSQKVNRDGWEQQTVYMPPDLRRWLKLYAATTERELSDIVTEAVQEFRIKQQRGGR